MSTHNDIRKVTIHYEDNQVDGENDTRPTDPLLTDSGKKNVWQNMSKHRFFPPAIYAVLGFMVFLSVIMIFNTYVLHLKVETAVVNTQIETMVAPLNGYISNVYVTTGEQVKKGAPLLKIENIYMERELQLAKIQSAESKLNIDYYEQLLSSEAQRLNIYKKIGNNRVISAKTQVNMSEQNVLTTQHNLARFTQLNKKHYISEASLEAERAKYLSAQEKLADAKAQQRIEKHALHAVSNGMYFTGTKTEGIIHDLDAELISAKKRAELNDQRVKVYERLIKKLTLVAPFDGKVTQILKSEGNTTDKIQPILFIEKQNSAKHIIAYLTQDEIIHIGAKNVKIYLPSLSKTYVGKIVEIDRTDGFIDEIKAQYRWRDFQIDRSAKVTIDIVPDKDDHFDTIAFSGMPVIVYFPKKFNIF